MVIAIQFNHLLYESKIPYFSDEISLFYLLKRGKYGSNGSTGKHTGMGQYQ